MFRASVGNRELEGIDLLRFNEDGLISDFTVFIRPLSGAGSVRPGDGREGRRGGPADEPLLKAPAGDRARAPGARRENGTARARLQRRRAPRPPAGCGPGAARRRRGGAGELLHLRHRPGGRGARPAQLPERLPAGQHRARAAGAARRRQGARARARAQRPWAPPRPTDDRHRHPAAGRAGAAPRAHDAPARAAAGAALRADPGARARPRADDPRRRAPGRRARHARRSARASSGRVRRWSCRAPEA